MSLVDRAKNIIMTPKTEWPAIAAEEPNVGGIYTGYVLILALIPAVASFIGYGIIGMGFLKSTTWGIAQGVIQLLSAFLVVFLTSLVVNALAPNFQSEKNMGRATQLVAYAYTPSWVAGILYIIPVLGILALLASLYGLYLMYLGIPVLMKTPQDKVVMYMVVSIVVLIIVYFVISAVLTSIIFSVFGLSVLGALR